MDHFIDMNVMKHLQEMGFDDDAIKLEKDRTDAKTKASGREDL
jgi:hypothetical protein